MISFGTSTAKRPRTGVAREELRKTGQFWTPDWVADAMVAYALQDGAKSLLDPALGAGAFFRAAKRNSGGKKITLWGRDIDPSVIKMAMASGLSTSDLAQVEIRDFVFDPPQEKFSAIVANPPYIRHHRISAAHKKELRDFSLKETGVKIDARAGLHVYFLIRALLALAPGGRLAFIVSSDICEGVFSKPLWQWICSRFRLDVVASFASQAAPFPDVDTNALIFCLRNAAPLPDFHWLTCQVRDGKTLAHAMTHQTLSTGISIATRTLHEGLATGLSRPPDYSTTRYTLGDFASVMRGVVTGDNDFFFLTSERAQNLGIDRKYLVPAVGRVRDINGDTFSTENWKSLDEAGRPTLLLHLNGHAFDDFSPMVQNYLRTGEGSGVPEKVLIKTRRPWYRMETRKIPPILFAYLGRRTTRFIRNRANVVPLTCLLCVYPQHESKDFMDRLWRVLSHPETVANLKKVGKSYGGGAIKVEPRSLEKLPLPDELVHAAGLVQFLAPKQGELKFA